MILQLDQQPLTGTAAAMMKRDDPFLARFSARRWRLAVARVAVTPRLDATRADGRQVATAATANAVGRQRGTIRIAVVAARRQSRVGQSSSARPKFFASRALCASRRSAGGCGDASASAVRVVIERRAADERRTFARQSRLPRSHHDRLVSAAVRRRAARPRPRTCRAASRSPWPTRKT